MCCEATKAGAPPAAAATEEDPEIAVTPAMLMAGMKEFYRDRAFEADHEWVARIYIAMRRQECLAQAAVVAWDGGKK
jgi:hypothetical protein